MTDQQWAAIVERLRAWRHKGKGLAEFTRADFDSYFHEVMHPGTVLTEEMVFILGVYLGKHSVGDVLPMRELRNDHRGRLDDVAIERVKLFRLERMDKDRWWMRLYMHASPDYVFDIMTSGRDIKITVETEEHEP